MRYHQGACVDRISPSLLSVITTRVDSALHARLASGHQTMQYTCLEASALALIASRREAASFALELDSSISIARSVSACSMGIGLLSNFHADVYLDVHCDRVMRLTKDS